MNHKKLRRFYEIREHPQDDRDACTSSTQFLADYVVHLIEKSNNNNNNSNNNNNDKKQLIQPQPLQQQELNDKGATNTKKRKLHHASERNDHDSKEIIDSHHHHHQTNRDIIHDEEEEDKNDKKNDACASSSSLSEQQRNDIIESYLPLPYRTMMTGMNTGAETSLLSNMGNRLRPTATTMTKTVSNASTTATSGITTTAIHELPSQPPTSSSSSASLLHSPNNMVVVAQRQYGRNTIIGYDTKINMMNQINEIRYMYLYGLQKVSELNDLQWAPDAILPGNMI
jgi:hypothetical protein